MCALPHGDDGLEELPDAVVPGVVGDGGVSQVAEDVVVLMTGALRKKRGFPSTTNSPLRLQESKM